MRSSPRFDPNVILKVHLLNDVGPQSSPIGYPEENYPFDPQQDYDDISWELLRCCLLRTLMSYKGAPTDRGGSQVFPDLAAAEPHVSRDGLTWTFQIRPGVHYSPPLQNVTGKAQDFVRAIDREACAVCSGNGYPQYYRIIEGFAKAYASKRTIPVSGIRATGPLTLQIHLTQPTGDLPYRFAMPATAPIPALPGHPSALLGIAAGHDDNDGQFALVGTGPYMIRGTDGLRFVLPARDQKPVSGYTPGKSIVFVHNPSWHQSNDPLRRRNVKEMDFSIGGTEEEAAHEVDTGQVDICLDCPPIRDQLSRYLSNSSLRSRVQIHSNDALRYISINDAQPPFDDVHVRKAVEFAIDKAGLRALREEYETPSMRRLVAPAQGAVATHIFPDSLENNVLLHYNPYQAANETESIARAKAEMRLSRYEHNRHGVCGDPVCQGVLTIIDQADPYPRQAAIIAHDLKP